MALIAVVVGVDVLFFRDRFWERLIVNIGIVLVILLEIPETPVSPAPRRFVDLRSVIVRRRKSECPMAETGHERRFCGFPGTSAITPNANIRLRCNIRRNGPDSDMKEAVN